MTKASYAFELREGKHLTDSQLGTRLQALRLCVQLEANGSAGALWQLLLGSATALHREPELL